MNRSLSVVCESVRRALQPAGSVFSLTRLEQENTIVDQYKGMQIHVQAQRVDANGWSCSIRICNAPHRALQSLHATVRATEAGVSLQAALGHAFTEAMSLCDLLLERKRSQEVR
ncbi:MAG: hypothetical protein H7234_03290 [Herminiimonas sp.]|nr:hypothetical protein [Herminiimonas sp.]